MAKSVMGDAAVMMAFGPDDDGDQERPNFVGSFFFEGWEYAWKPWAMARRPYQPADLAKLNQEGDAMRGRMEKIATIAAAHFERFNAFHHLPAAEVNPIGVAKMGENGLRLYVCGIPVHFENFRRIIEMGGDWSLSAVDVEMRKSGREGAATRALSMRRGDIQAMLAAATEC